MHENQPLPGSSRSRVQAVSRAGRLSSKAAPTVMYHRPHTISNKHYDASQLEDHTMKWITRSDVHVDRVACPWLISSLESVGEARAPSTGGPCRSSGLMLATSQPTDAIVGLDFA